MTRSRATLIIAFLLAWLSVLGLRSGSVTNVPVERLINNLSRYIEENPDDSRAVYSLGRVHALAFAQLSDTVLVRQGLDRDPPELSRLGEPLVRFVYPFIPSAESKHHLNEAILKYRKAIHLDGDKALYYLGLGWMFQQGAMSASHYGVPPGSAPCGQEHDSLEIRTAVRDLANPIRSAAAFQLLLDQLPCAITRLVEGRFPRLPQRILVDRLISRAWEDEALDAYRRAHELSFNHDYRTGGGGSGVISIEAAQYIIDILRWYRTVGEATLEAREEIEYMVSRIEAYNSVSRAISPIIFSASVSRLGLSSLIDDDAVVTFDLDGDGESELWPWILPNAAFLVWDPTGEGKIDSGLQLFGNVTWWMFWDHGYDPLRALDDNDDGWLTGNELNGIAVWQDADMNAISDSKEVVPAQCAGVVGIAVRPTGEDAGVPCNKAGLMMSDGRRLPTYDWTPTSLGPPIN